MKIKVLLVLLCLSSLGFSQISRFDSVVDTTVTISGQTGLRQVVAGALVTVCTYPAATFGACSKVALCTDSTGSSCSTGTNPVTADSYANFGFWIAPGKYDYWITANAVNSGPYHIVVAQDVGNSLVQYADAFSGATADVKINACLAKIPNGGTCDARGFGATTQTIAATVEVGLSSKTVTLLLDPATIYQPSTNSIDMFKVDKNGQLKGLHIVFPASMVYAAHAVSVLDTITNNNTFSIDGMFVDALSESSGGTGNGYCLYIAPPTGSYVQLTTFKHIRCAGLKFGIYLSASGANTYINGNTFTDVILTGDGTLLTLDTTATGLQIKGNLFANMVFDGLGVAIKYLGTANVSSNIFSSSYIWDTTTPISNSGNGVANTFIGSIDHTYTDAVASQSYLLPSDYTTQNLHYTGLLQSARVDTNAFYFTNGSSSGAHSFCDKNGNNCFSITMSSGTPAFSSFTAGAAGYKVAGVSELYTVTTDFTVAANTNLQTITGLTWTLPASTALTVPFECHLLYSQATAAVADQFGIQSATISPTNIASRATAYISASTFTTGNVPTLSSTTATPIVTFTPSASATVFGADLYGVIENPSNASANVINVMTQTSNSADLMTIKRGSYCKLF